MDEQSLIRDPQKFRWEYGFLKDLAHGGEGKVSLWENKSTGRLIAVKEPVADKVLVREALQKEIKSMTKLGQHPHIVRFLGSANDWNHLSPAIFYEFCELGDVHDYSHRVLKSGSCVPEPTIWKFLMDMTKGLDYLHNCLDVPYVHGDLKPGNILVSRPPGDCTVIPLMPTFKLADISHLTAYDRKGRSAYNMYAGTYEFGPPLEERKHRLAPSVDIWAIGVSLQTLAWGILPIKSNTTIRRELIAVGWPADDESIRKLKNDDRYRRAQLTFVWRPMNAKGIDQLTKYDMDSEHPPYSDALNAWYSMCLHENPKSRITSKVLMEYFLPLADQQLQLLLARKRRDDAFEKVRLLKAKAHARRNQSKSRASPQTRESIAARVPARNPVPERKDPAKANVKGKKKADLDDGKGKKKFSRF